MIKTNEKVSTTSTLYNYSITPSSLTNTLGNAVTSGTITHTLTFTNGMGETSEPVTFVTKLKAGPSVSLSSTDTTISSISVNGSSSNTDTKKYEFKIGNGSWINNGTANTYTFSGLAEKTGYVIYVRVTNDVGLTASANKTISTASSVTCKSEGGCTCSGTSLTGSVYNVCRDQNGNVVSSTLVHSCSGSCNSGSSGGDSSSCSCSCSAACDTLKCSVEMEGYYEEGDSCTAMQASTILKCCASQGITCPTCS